MRVLAFSTSTPAGSVAIVEPGRVLAEVATVSEAAHAERLYAALDEVLARAGTVRDRIDGIACDLGPGSFTGVRIGVAVGQGIAVGLGRPAAGVTSLEALARATPGDGVVLGALDAKRGELYAALFAAGPAGLCVRAEPLCVPTEALLDVVRGAAPPDVEASEVAEFLARVAAARPALRLAGEPFSGESGFGGARHPRASDVAALALARGAWSGPEALEPRYVRAPDAKLPVGTETKGSG